MLVLQKYMCIKDNRVMRDKFVFFVSKFEIKVVQTTNSQRITKLEGNLYFNCKLFVRLHIFDSCHLPIASNQIKRNPDA